MNTKKVWYITGASKGLGLALVKKLLNEGYRVAATSRKAEQLKKAIGSINEDQFLALEVDLTNDESIKQSIQKAQAHFGQLDVVVNNAGYGIGGSIEELSQKDVYDNFNVNVFATIKVIHHALPVMRAQKSGHIINISSIGGFAGATGWSVYAATKFAITGMSEVLAEEVRELGIKVTVVAPGGFRTEFLSAESLVMAENIISDYQSIRDSHASYNTMNGKQAGDPDKAAEVFIALAENPKPPVRLFLGSDAYTRASAKITQLGNDLEQWKDLTLSTDFPV